MADKEYTPYPFPFINKGLAQKDPALLTEGEFYQSRNISTLADGAITTRLARKRLGVISGQQNPVKIQKLSWSRDDTLNPRYVSQAGLIYRTFDYITFTQVADTVALVADVYARRFNLASAAAGALSGDPYAYLATPLKMLKDSGRTAYTPLRRWGILPPSAAASAAVGTPFSKAIVSSPVTHTSTTVDYEYQTLGSSFDLAAFTSPSVKDSGFQRDGYDSEDYIKIRVVINDVGALVDMRLQFDCSDGSFETYYEKSILPSNITDAVILSQVTTDALLDRNPDYLAQIVGPFDSPDIITQTGKPYELQPAYTSLDQIVKIKKVDFLKVGGAGVKNQNTLNWKSIVAVRLVTKQSVIGEAVQIYSMDLIGGYGPNSEATVNSAPYDYLYVHRNTVTGNVGNPSPAMIEKNFVRASREPVTVTVWGIDDANISGADSIAIYRRGGLLTDAYRLVGHAANPGESGGVPLSVAFVDSLSDADIVNAQILEFDNDPPVNSLLGSPIRATLGSTSAGWFTFTLSVSTADLTVGSKLAISRTGDSSFDETVTVQALGPGNTIRSYFQYAHNSGDTVSCESVTGKGCNGALSAYESIFVWGDSNNPHILYKSKRGRPESFPIVNGDGTSNAIIVGSPGNPIRAVTEYGGELLCLNAQRLYVVKVWLSTMTEPIEMPTQRGVHGSEAWCKGDNVIYYMSYDGVYAWSGGESIPISKDIEWMFKRRTINGITPIQLGTTRRDQITFSFHNSFLFINCYDLNDNQLRLRYDTTRGAWSIDNWTSPLFGPNFMFSEVDTARLISCGFDSSSGWLDEEEIEGTAGASDDYTGSAGTNGTAIPFLFRTGFFAPGGPSITKLFGDVILELFNPSTAVTVKIYYDHSATADGTDQFTIAAGAGRRLIPLPLQQGGGYTNGKEARSISVEVSGTGIVRCEFYSLTFNAIPLAQVQFGRTTDWDDAGHPHDKRLFEVVMEVDTGGASIDFALDTLSGIAGATVTNAVQTFTLAGAGRTLVTLKATDGIIAKKFRLRPTVETVLFRVYSQTFICENYPPDMVPFTPYTDYEYPYEKHFQVLHLDVDTGGASVSVGIEVDGVTLQTVVASSTDPTRSLQFGLNDNLIGRLVRIKPDQTATKFQLHKHRFEFEKYPPNVIYFTEPSDFGYPYLKYLQQLVLDVNTAGAAVPVTVEGDGVSLQTLSVTTTNADRKRLLALSASLTAKKIRLVVGSIPGGGRFQLFSHDIIFRPADKGPIAHTFDWDTLGYEFGKRLTQLVLEYDKGAASCSMVMDTITGINGDVITLAVVTIVLTGTGRSVQPVALPDGTIVKAIRLRPVSVPNVDFKHWDYKFTFEKLPPDVTPFTEWTDLGWKCAKTFRSVSLEVDTGGIAASVQLQVDGTTVSTQTITSTDSDRGRILSFPTSASGKMFRIKSTPGTGGKFQIYDYKVDFVREPCDLIRWDSLEISMGLNCFKFLKQAWIQYTCASAVTLRIYVDGETLFHTETLPVQATKEIYRFYFPSYLTGTPNVLNKSKRYRFLLTAATPFKLWAESSRVEWMPIGWDQRQSWVQLTFQTMMQPAALMEPTA